MVVVKMQEIVKPISAQMSLFNQWVEKKSGEIWELEKI